MLFCKANIDQAIVVKEVLSCYENASGQKVNLGKSSVMFDILNATVGNRPSFTWHIYSLWGARRLILKGSRWLVGNGESVRMWDSRPYSCKPIPMGNERNSSLNYWQKCRGMERRRNPRAISTK